MIAFCCHFDDPHGVTHATVTSSGSIYYTYTHTSTCEKCATGITATSEELGWGSWAPRPSPPPSSPPPKPRLALKSPREVPPKVPRRSPRADLNWTAALKSFR